MQKEGDGQEGHTWGFLWPKRKFKEISYLDHGRKGKKVGQKKKEDCIGGKVCCVVYSTSGYESLRASGPESRRGAVKVRVDILRTTLTCTLALEGIA